MIWNYYVFVDCFVKVFSQPIGFGKHIVGQAEDVICSISVSADVNAYNVELGWLYDDDIITNDSRVTINTSNGYFNDSTVVTVIQFDPLIEDDKDKEYFCYSILNGSLIYEFVNLKNFMSKLLYAYVCYT